MLFFLRYLILAAIILTSCSLDELIGVKTHISVHEYKNPHAVCVNCHVTDTPQPGSASFNPGTDPSSLCLNCHDYDVNHHPVNFIPANATGIPLPLFEGEIRCLTCHEIHGGPNHKGTRKLLRGGPYADRREICFKCHVRERYSALDPHQMLDNAGNVNEVNGKPVCLVCHLKKPDPAVDWTNDVTFRADIGFLCWRCHPPMPGDFFNQHFLVTPSAETMQNMQTTEERLLVILPLVPRGRITCSTCHNPHQSGVITRHEAAAKGADAINRLRMTSICFGCHRV